MRTCCETHLGFSRHQGHLTLNLQRHTWHSEGKFSAQCVSNKNIHSGRLKLVKHQQMRNTSVGQKVYAPADVKRIQEYNKNVTSLKTLEGFASADMIEACDTVSLFSYK